MILAKRRADLSRGRGKATKKQQGWGWYEVENWCSGEAEGVICQALGVQVCVDHCSL